MKIQYMGRCRHTAIAGLLLAASLMFAACGDAGTSTPIPQPTAAATTAAASTTAAANGNATVAGATGATSNAANPANGTPGGGNGNAAPEGGGGANRPNFSPPVNGTIESYDDATRTLTVKAANGTSEKFDATNARITRPEKITSAELGQLAAGNGIVQVVGQKGSDGSYNATRLTVLDLAAFGGGNGNGGGGRGQGFNGTPRANMTPGAGAGAGGGRPGNGGPNGIIVRGGTLSGTKLTGTDFAGEPITVNLSDSTVMVKQTAGVTTDLKAGQNVIVTSRIGQGSGVAMALNIALELQ